MNVRIPPPVRRFYFYFSPRETVSDKTGAPPSLSIPALVDTQVLDGMRRQPAGWHCGREMSSLNTKAGAFVCALTCFNILRMIMITYL